MVCARARTLAVCRARGHDAQLVGRDVVGRAVAVGNGRCAETYVTSACGLDTSQGQRTVGHHTDVGIGRVEHRIGVHGDARSSTRRLHINRTARCAYITRPRIGLRAAREHRHVAAATADGSIYIQGAGFGLDADVAAARDGRTMGKGQGAGLVDQNEVVVAGDRQTDQRSSQTRRMSTHRASGCHTINNHISHAANGEGRGFGDEDTPCRRAGGQGEHFGFDVVGAGAD